MNFTNLTTAQGLADNEVYVVSSDGDTIYAATYGGLSMITSNSSVNRYTSHGLGSNDIYNLRVFEGHVYVSALGLFIRGPDW